MSEESRNFALNRTQFGRPITKFQGLQCMLADMSISLKPSHVVLNDAVHSAGDGFPDICAAAQAKMFASETAIKVTQHALKIHLLMGYPRDVPMERLTRDTPCSPLLTAPHKSCAHRWPVPPLVLSLRKLAMAMQICTTKWQNKKFTFLRMSNLSLEQSNVS